MSEFAIGPEMGGFQIGGLIADAGAAVVHSIQTAVSYIHGAREGIMHVESDPPADTDVPKDTPVVYEGKSSQQKRDEVPRGSGPAKS